MAVQWINDYVPVRHQPRFRLLDFMRQVGRDDLIMLGAGIPDPGLLPRQELIEAFQRADSHTGGRFLGYHVPEGDPECRAVLAARMRARGVDIPENETPVILTTGCTQALHLALAVNLSPGDIVAVECPCYYNLLEQIDYFDCRVLPVPTDPARGLDVEAFEALADQYRPRVLVVCSSLSNPTGATIPVGDRARLVEVCRRRGIQLIEDDIYAELCEGEVPPPLRAYDDGTTVSLISSFCKTVSPGLRVGYILPGRHFEAVAARKCLMDMHSPSLTEATLREYLRRPDSNAIMERMRGILSERRGMMSQAIREHFPPGTGVAEPGGGFLIWAVLPGWVDMPALRVRALECGVTIATGDVFLTEAPLRGCMRLNAAKATPEDMIRGIRLLGELLE